MIIKSVQLSNFRNYEALDINGIEEQREKILEELLDVR